MCGLVWLIGVHHACVKHKFIAYRPLYVTGMITEKHAIYYLNSDTRERRRAIPLSASTEVTVDVTNSFN